MYKIETDLERYGSLQSLLTSVVTRALEPREKGFASISGLQPLIKSVTKTIDVVRIMLEAEFNFTGVVDGTDPGRVPKSVRNLLEVDWFDCTFAVAAPGNASDWAKKAIEESDFGRTVVLVLPAKTSTQWFHKLVLQRASEVRFVRGSISHRGQIKAGYHSDCVVIYRRIGNLTREGPGEVGVFDLHTSMTSPGAKEARGEDMEDEDE